jgi:hypothetical protein
MDDVDLSVETKSEINAIPMLLGQNKIEALRKGENLQATLNMFGPTKPVDLTAEDLKNARGGKPDEMLKKLEAVRSKKRTA